MRGVLLPSTLFLLVGAGCSFSPFGGAPSGGGTPGTAVGFSSPTLEVTIGGVHFGPAAPDNGSAASLVNTVDQSTGRVQQSVFRLSAATASKGDSCGFSFQRVGDGIAPIGKGSYFVSAGGTSRTTDGTVEPIQGEGVIVPQGTWTCSGDACAGGAFQITVLDATHVEGFLGGNLQSASGGPNAAVTCAFWVPLQQ